MSFNYIDISIYLLSVIKQFRLFLFYNKIKLFSQINKFNPNNQEHILFSLIEIVMALGYPLIYLKKKKDYFYFYDSFCESNSTVSIIFLKCDK